MFRTILRMTQTELFDYLVDILKEKNYNVIVGKNNILNGREYIAAKGNIPIVLLAHLDTVFPDETRKNMSIYHDSEQGVIWSPNGLGADDRAGVYMILQILETTDLRPHILFTTDEESTSIGAEAVSSKRKELFGEVSYIIELDRQGYKECVFYDCDNPQFQKLIENYGFKTEQGTFTDISIICPSWGVAGVNLSVGYLWEHSYIEHFYSAMWYDTYRKVLQMLNDKDAYSKTWKYIPKEPKIDFLKKYNKGIKKEKK